MIEVKKWVTDYEKMYTYYEFEGYDDWDQFMELYHILTEQMGCNVLEAANGMWSRHCDLEKDGFVFELMYHDDFGNCLRNRDRKNSDYYHKLGLIAKEAAFILNQYLEDAGQQ
jgi:hypothetical protein